MKTFNFSMILAIVLLGAAAIAVSGIAPAKQKSPESFSAKELPPLVLEKCIEVQKLIGPNPSSPLPNDYLMVTQYQEKPEEAGTARKGLIPGRAMNIYLVQGVLVSENRHIALLHDSVLIVKVSTSEAKASGETVREWILIDENGDRNIDKGIFRETFAGMGKGLSGSHEVVIPRDRLQELQAYYDEAVATLDTRAAEGRSKDCVIT